MCAFYLTKHEDLLPKVTQFKLQNPTAHNVINTLTCWYNLIERQVNLAIEKIKHLQVKTDKINENLPSAKSSKYLTDMDDNHNVEKWNSVI